MSDQQSSNIDSNILRMMINDAVQRQIVNEIAPIRTQQQIQEGVWKQLNRDLQAANSLFRELDELVRGNPKQNLIGLAEQIHTQNEQILLTRRELSKAIDNVKAQLGVKIDAISVKQDDASTRREALINQARGARWALLALAVVTGLPYLETIGKLVHLLP